MRMMNKEIMMVRGGILFAYLQFLFYIDFIIAFIISSSIIFVFLSIMNHFIQLYLCVFFAHAGEMASVYDEIDVKDEPLFPSLECDQVGSVLYDPYVYY